MSKSQKLIFGIIALILVVGVVIYFVSANKKANSQEVTSTSTVNTQTKTGLGNLDLGAIAGAIVPFF